MGTRSRGSGVAEGVRHSPAAGAGKQVAVGRIGERLVAGSRRAVGIHQPARKVVAVAPVARRAARVALHRLAVDARDLADRLRLSKIRRDDILQKLSGIQCK